MAADLYREYNDGSCEVQGIMNAGRLKLTGNKIVFSHIKSGKKDTVKAEDMKLVNWQRFAGAWGIRIFTKDEQLHR